MAKSRRRSASRVMLIGTGWLSDDLAQPPLARRELGERPLLGRDVEVEAADPDDPAGRVAHREADHHAPGVGVAALEALLPPGRLAPLQHLRVEAADRRRLLRRQHLLGAAAQQLGGRPAEDAAHLRVEHQVAAVEALQVHADRRVLHERGQPRLALLERRLGPHALADVAPDRDEVGEAAGRVAERRDRGVLEDRAAVPVAAHQAAVPGLPALDRRTRAPRRSAASCRSPRSSSAPVRPTASSRPQPVRRVNAGLT